MKRYNITTSTNISPKLINLPELKILSLTKEEAKKKITEITERYKESFFRDEEVRHKIQKLQEEYVDKAFKILNLEITECANDEEKKITIQELFHT